MELERKIFPGAEFKVVDAAQGIAEMIVSVFHNQDSMNEIVMPGFFAESLSNRRTTDGRPRAKGVWSHDWASPVAKTLDAQELMPGDTRLPTHLAGLGGLWVKAQFNLDTQRGREAFSDLQFGTVDEFSIGYSVTEASWDNQTGVRKLMKGDWYEWSPVLVGANSQTALLSTKMDLPYTDHLDAVVAAAQDLTERSRSRVEYRAKEGRTLSQANREKLAALRDALRSLHDEIDTLLAETEPAPKEDAGKARRLRARAVGLALSLRSS